MCLSTLEEIARLNNAGVSYLAMGAGGQAVRAFKAALTIVSSISQRNHDASMTFFQNKQHCISRSQAVPGLNATFFVYSNGLLIDPSEDTDIVFSNSLILFNLALAFHQRGMVYNQEDKLRKALSLYELCMQLMSESELSPCSVALLLIALNNSAQILFELADYENAAVALEMLYQESVHVSLLDCPPAMLEQHHIEEFYLNVLLTIRPTAAACA